MRVFKAKSGAVRYPIVLQVRYRAMSPQVGIFGVGRTHYMSSSEVIFSCDHVIEPGMAAEIGIAWPAKIDDTVRLQLVIEGSVTRVDQKIAAVRITRYHFRTRGQWDQTESRSEAKAAVPWLPSSVRPMRPVTPAKHSPAANGGLWLTAGATGSAPR